MSKFRLIGYTRKRESFRRGKDLVEKEDGYEIIHTKYDGKEISIYVYENNNNPKKKSY